MNLFIGCSASDYIPSKYVLDCRKFLEGLFEYGHDLVFGGSESGLMGLAYNIALEKGRNIKAVYPYVYRDGVKNLECEKILTNTINQRTERVIQFGEGGFLRGFISFSYPLPIPPPAADGRCSDCRPGRCSG